MTTVAQVAYPVGMQVEIEEYPDDDIGEPPPYTARTRADLDSPNVTVTLDLIQYGTDDRHLDPWQVRGLTVEAADGQPVTSALIRRIPVGELLALSVNKMTPVLLTVASGADLKAAGQRGPDDETLRLVGEVYESTRMQSGSPVQFIVDHFGISRSTATRWVRKARDRGLIRAMARADAEDAMHAADFKAARANRSGDREAAAVAAQDAVRAHEEYVRARMAEDDASEA